MTINEFKLAALAISALMITGCASNSAPVSSAAPAPEAAATERTVEKQKVVVTETTTESSMSKETMSKDEKVAKVVEEHNEAVEDDDDRIVCRKYKKTGSHFSRTRCVTAAQMKKEAEDAQEALQRASRGSNVGPDN